MANEKDYSNDIIINKKGYSVSTDESENQTVFLNNFMPEKKKNLTVNLNNYGDNNTYHSSLFAETISVNNGAYSMYLYGKGNKTVKLGSTSGNDVRILNSGKNTITAGDGGNTFELSNYGAKNTLATGTGNDAYYINWGTNKITDRGGENEYHVDSISTNTITSGTGVDKYYIARGTNNIVDKGGDNEFYYDGVEYYGTVKTGAGADTFDIIAKSSDGNLKIYSGNGTDTLKIHNRSTSFYYPYITADLGNDKDYVFVDYKEGTDNISFTNIKTGKGEDEVTISAGKENIIDTGADKDIITIDGGLHNYINSGDGNDEITVKTPDLVISTPTNIIRAGKGSDTIELGFGTNTVYGDAGIDTITATGGTNTIYGGNGKDEITTSGTSINTIYADGDEINLNGGNNTIYTTKKGNTITTTDGANTINFKQGGNTLINNGNPYIETVNVAENNKITVNGNGAINITATSGAQTITLNDTGNIYGTLGKGNDIITSSSTVSDATNSLNAGAGNDKFYLSKGNKIYRGGAGNDYFQVTGYTESGNILWGDSGKDIFDIYKKCTVFAGDDNDTLNIKGGISSSIDGGEGVDTFNIEGSEDSMVASNTINGGNGNDIFNIKTLYSVANTYNGREGVDTFNIYNGSNDKINGGEDNDIYNLYGSSGSTITDDNGANTYNIKKNYEGQTNIKDTTSSAKFVFDKSYKLSNESNVNDDDTIVTDSNTLTLFANFSKSTSKIDGYMSLIFDIEHGGYTENYLSCQNVEAFDNIYNIKGKNYTLDFSALEQDLVTWFGEHNTYSGSIDVMNGSSAEDKASLLAVFTENTQNCFR